MMTLMSKSEIINLHIQGKSKVEIASTLDIHRNTVGTYVQEYKRLQSELMQNKDNASVVRETGCIVDRIQHKAHIVDMTVNSYRVMETKKWMKEGMENK